MTATTSRIDALMARKVSHKDSEREREGEEEIDRE